MTNPVSNTQSYWLCPLYLFTMDVDSIRLVNDVSIVKSPRELVDRIYEQTEHLYGIWSDPSRFDWCLSIPTVSVTHQINNRVSSFSAYFNEMDRINEVFYQTISAIKLKKAGRLTCGPLISGIFDGTWRVGGSTNWTILSKRDFQDDQPHYHLKQSEIVQIDDLILKIKNLSTQNKLNNLSVALEMFHSSHYGQIKDRLFNQVVALESMLLENDSELKYRLSLRTAFLLRQRLDHRQKIFEMVKQAYNFRSRVVHGSNPPSKDKLRKIVPFMDQYLRESIIKFVRLLEFYDLPKIREMIDLNILSNGRVLRNI